MRVRLLAPYTYADEKGKRTDYVAGEVADLPDSEAKRLVRRKQAEIVNIAETLAEKEAAKLFEQAKTELARLKDELQQKADELAEKGKTLAEKERALAEKELELAQTEAKLKEWEVGLEMREKELISYAGSEGAGENRDNKGESRKSKKGKE